MHDIIPDVIPNEKKPIAPPTGIEEWYDDYEDVRNILSILIGIKLYKII